MDTTRIERVLDLIRSGGKDARDELLRLANDSAARATRRLLSAFPTVAAWYETGDVRQLALLKLNRAFEAVEIQDAAHFHRLVASKVRQTLLDSKRQLCGARGPAVREQREADAPESAAVVFEPCDETHDPRRLSEWLDIHTAIDTLPDDCRTMFDLLWYGELSQEEVARTLGISVRHVRRRWREARLRLWETIPEAFES